MQNPGSLTRLGLLSSGVSGCFLTSQSDGAAFGATGGCPWPHLGQIYVLKPPTIGNAKPTDKRDDLTDGGG
jgi:hypothetical protein